MIDEAKKIQSKYQSEFDHKWACWAANHNGWAKAKRDNHKRAMKQFRRQGKKEIADFK